MKLKLLAFSLFLLSPIISLAHTVTLQSCVDSTPGVTYNFYRGTQPSTTVGGVTTYYESTVPLNSAPLPNCNYVDTSVVGNTTYYYVAKAYCSTCSPTLSSPSNEVMAQVPADAGPPAPTGLSLGMIAKNSVPLQWIAPSTTPRGYYLAAYEVTRSLYSGFSPSAVVAIVPPVNTSYTDKCPKATCYYYVKAYWIDAASFFTLSPMSNSIEAVIPSS